MLFKTAKAIQVWQKRKITYKSVLSWYSGLVKKRPPEAPFTHIVQIGDPILRSGAEEIPHDFIKTDEMKFLISRMKKVMQRYECVGLAAPQIGIPLQLFVMEFNKKHLNSHKPKEIEFKEMEQIPLTVVINPKVEVIDYKKITFVEHCESVRGFHAEVPRYRGVKLNFVNENCEKQEIEKFGWPSRIIQHEMDHLKGVVYTDIMNRESLTCSCWEVINERGGKIELPYSC